MQQIKNQFTALTRIILNLVQGISNINETLKNNKPSEVKVVVDLESIKGDKPVYGVDYLTDEEKKKMTDEIFARVQKPENGKDADEIKIYNSLYKRLSRMIPKSVDIKAVETTILKKVISPSEHNKSVSRMIKEALKSIPKLSDFNKLVSEQKAQSFENIISDSANVKLIARGLERLKGKDRLDARKLKNLPQGGGGTSGGGSGSSATFIENELVGTGPGTAFTLDNMPVAGSVHLYAGGIRQILTEDYSIVGLDITFVNSVPQDIKVIADYRI